MTRSIDLNADAGESFGAWTMGNDEGLFPLLTSVNIACGFHAGDPLTMRAAIERASKYRVGVGAHPGYPDLPGFGRRILEATPEQVYADVLYQISALAGMCRAAGVPLRHVKAHGALSTRAWTHAETAAAIAQATRDFSPALPLVVLPATLLETEARALGVPVVLETFPERAYLRDGRLAPRSMPGSSIHDPREAAHRAVMMVKEHRIEAVDGGFFEFEVDTLCIHGDNPQAVQIARAVRAALEQGGVEIRAFPIPEPPAPEVQAPEVQARAVTPTAPSAPFPTAGFPDTAFPELREPVRELCARFDARYWREAEQDGYPEAFVRALTEAGWLAALIPEAYGGAGLGLTEASVILEEINRSGANSGACHAQMYIMGTLLRHGSEAQKDEYLPRIARGELRLQSFGVTEPASGSDTTKLRTTAVKRGDHYLVNGQKIWTSRLQHSDLLLLLARTTPLPDVRKKTEGLSTFLIDLREVDQSRLTVRPIENMVGHETNEVFFDDLEIPARSLVGEEGQGFRYVLDGMNAERILIAAECVGDGYWFTERASRYANDRVVFDRPIGQNQGVQFPIARAYVNVRAADLMRYQAAALFDAGKPCGAEANMSKLLAADASWEAANACLQTHGGFGFAAEYDVERKFRETRLYQVAPISTNLILSFVGEKVLGMPRSYS